MTKQRLEAFSDGVIAILITIMVLELKVPHGPDFHALQPLLPVLFSYVVSFVFVGIYWNNHHHMMHEATTVNGRILWANLYLLFWLSLIPFVTEWVGENDFAAVPIAAYGFVMLMCGFAYVLLQSAIIKLQGPESRLKKAVGRDLKGKASAALYSIAIPMAFFNRWVSGAIYLCVALMWFLPDPRIERNQTPH